MADYVAGGIGYSGYSDGRYNDRVSTHLVQVEPLSKTFRGRLPLESKNGAGASAVVRYRMRAQDSGAAPTAYVTWTVTTTPDFAGVNYYTGTPTPVGPFVPGSIVVAETWRELE